MEKIKETFENLWNNRKFPHGFDDANNSGEMVTGTVFESILSNFTKQWFVLSLSKKESGKKPYLIEVEKRMTQLFHRSNFYNSLYSLLRNFRNYGAGAMMIVEDFQSGIRCRSFSEGEYAIGLNADLKAEAFVRKIELTTTEIVQEFGKSDVPLVLRNDYDAGKNLNYKWEICQLISLNADKKEGLRDCQNMEFSSTYWISGTDVPIRRSGFHEFPVAVIAQSEDVENFFESIVARVFMIMHRAGLLPDFPPESEGKEVEVEVCLDIVDNALRKRNEGSDHV